MSPDSGAPLGADRWEELEQVYAHALGLSPEARGEFLDRRCADDAVLREEVESLLACAEEAPGFVGRLAREVAELPAEAFREGLVPGARVGPYVVLEELGRGGMGVVYKARDERLDRFVALKFLPAHLSAAPGGKRRFAAEARAASATEHANIAALHEIGETDDGRLYLVLAYYEGETLKERIARGPLPPEEAVDIACQSADGLAAAHARGVVHRDVKPGNLLVTPDGWVKILDFGVAKMADVELTGPGVRLGTMAYMSPEQLRGEPVDERTDIWSLGVVLYEMLTGRRPFAGDREEAVARAILHTDPAGLPSSGDGGRARGPSPDTEPGIPPGLAPILRRALARDPADRFATAAELREALEKWKSGSSALGLRRSPLDPSRRFLRRRPVWLGVAGVALLAAAAALVLDLLPSAAEPAAPSPHRVAVLPFTVRGDAEYDYLAEGMMDLLTAKLKGGGDLYPVEPSSLMEFLEAGGSGTIGLIAGRRAARHFGAGAYVVGNVVEAGGQLELRATLHRSDGAPPITAEARGGEDSLFDLVDELAKQLLVEMEGGDRLVRLAASTTPSLSALKHFLAGERAMRAGRFWDAIEAFERATALDGAFALAHYRTAVAAGWLNRHELSRAAAEQAVRYEERLSPVDRRLLGAHLAWRRGEATDAERLYREVLELRPDSPEAWYGLGEVLFHFNPLRGRSFEEAREAFERALAYGPFQMESVIHLADLAAWERRGADYDSLYAMMLGLDADMALVYGAQYAFARGDSAAREEVWRSLATADHRAIRHALGRVAALSGDPAASRRLARMLTDPARPPEWRTDGHLMMALLEAAAGRWLAARLELEAAEVLVPSEALPLYGLLAAQPYLAVPAEEVDSARAALARWDVDARPVGTLPRYRPHDVVRPHLRFYLLGLLSVRLGDTDAAGAFQDSLVRLGPSPESEDLPLDLTLTLEAERAALEGRPRRALSLLEGGRLERPYELLVRSPFYNQAHARYLRAELLRDAGRLREALGWYVSLFQFPADGVLYEAPARLRMAEIHETLGNPERAAREYASFIDLWREADPPLQPAVERAEARLAELRATVSGE